MLMEVDAAVHWSPSHATAAETPLSQTTTDTPLSLPGLSGDPTRLRLTALPTDSGFDDYHILEKIGQGGMGWSIAPISIHSIVWWPSRQSMLPPVFIRHYAPDFKPRQSYLPSCSIAISFKSTVSVRTMACLTFRWNWSTVPIWQTPSRATARAANCGSIGGDASSRDPLCPQPRHHSSRSKAHEHLVGSQ